jgi:hypothetical protein
MGQDLPSDVPTKHTNDTKLEWQRVGRVVPDKPFYFPSCFSREENKWGESPVRGNNFVSFESFARRKLIAICVFPFRVFGVFRGDNPLPDFLGSRLPLNLPVFVASKQFLHRPGI